MKLTKIFSRIIVLTVCLLPGFLQQGCTRNNGDIGNWFGRWQITEILADGTPESGYRGEFFLDFQNDIIRGIQLAPNGYNRDTASSAPGLSRLTMHWCSTSPIIRTNRSGSTLLSRDCIFLTTDLSHFLFRSLPATDAPCATLPRTAPDTPISSISVNPLN